MNEHGAEFLAGRYQPPLKRYPELESKLQREQRPEEWARAAA